MKILHFITTMSSGGAEKMLSKIVTLDDENEHIIVTLFDSELHYEIKNVKLINISGKNNLLSNFLAIFKLKKIVNMEKPDIIQTWLKLNYYGPFLKLFSHAKLIANYRNGYTDNFKKIQIKLLNIWNKNFDNNIFVSETALEERLINGFNFTKPIIITNGFKSQSYRYHFKDDSLTIGHISRFHKVKNQQMIVDSFNEFSTNKDVSLILAGRNLKDNLTNITDEKIEFLGNLKDTSIFYKNIDVLILASHSEGFPNVIGEAMSYGVPVIASNAGESHKIIGESGFKLFHNTKDELTSTMEKIYVNKEILLEKSVWAKAIIDENYDINMIIKKYQDLYRS